MNRIKYVTAKLASMRKPQAFLVYAKGWGLDENILKVQSDKSIGRFDIESRQGYLNCKNAHSLDVNKGAIAYKFPLDFVNACIEAQPKKGQMVATGFYIG